MSSFHIFINDVKVNAKHLAHYIFNSSIKLQWLGMFFKPIYPKNIFAI